MSVPELSWVSRLFRHWLPALAFFLVIAHYSWFVFSHAINIPFQDDIYDFLQVVELIESADNSTEALRQWFRQYNNHRTSASRLQVYTVYSIEGEVNFRTLTMLANLALPLILLLFYFGVKEEEYRWHLLLVSALLLLHFRYYSLILMAQGSFAYFYSFFYAFAGLFALHKVTVPKFILAAVMCSLSAFSLAAGQIAWILGLVSLLHQSFVIRNRSLIYPIAWLTLTVVMFLVWRCGYIVADSEFFSTQKLERIETIFPDNLINAPIQQVLARYAGVAFVILGSAATDTSTLVAGLTGLLTLAVLVFVTIRFYRSHDIRFTLCCWYAVGCSLAVAAGRAFLAKPEEFLHFQNRYSFLSVMLMSTLTVLVQLKFKLFRLSAVYLLVLLAFGYSIWAYSHFASPMQALTDERYKAFNNDHYPVFGRSGAESKAIISEAISSGMYKPPCRPFPQCQETLSREPWLFE